MALPEPLVTIEEATTLKTRLGLDVPPDRLAAGVTKFNNLLQSFVINPVNNNKRILGDLTHDIGGFIKTNIGPSNIIKYLGESSELSADQQGQVLSTVNEFLTDGGNPRPDNITNWLNQYLASISKNIDTCKITNNVTEFKNTIISFGCEGIILDSQFENVVEYFKGSGKKFFFPSVTFCDGAKKLSNKSVDELGLIFHPHEDPFRVLKFFDSRIHTFSVNGPLATVSVSKQGQPGNILETKVKGGFSVNGITLTSFGQKVRNKGKGQSGEGKVNKPVITQPLTEEKKKELILVKTITDYSQVYYAAFLYHVFDYKTVFITNDTFCLPLACLFELPFAILSKKFNSECYIFDIKALRISDTDKLYLNQINAIDLAPIIASINIKLSDRNALYNIYFNEAVEINDIIAADIALQDIISFKSEIDERIAKLNAFKAKPDKTDDDYRSIMGIARSGDIITNINNYLIGSTLEHIENKYQKNIMCIRKRITALQLNLSLESIADCINYINDIIPYTKILSNIGIDVILPLFLALIYYNDSSTLTYLIEYFYDNESLTPEEFQRNINNFRKIARYIYVFNLSFSILGRIFFDLKTFGQHQSTFNNNVKQFLPIISFLNNNYTNPGVSHTPSVNSLTNEEVSKIGNIYREKYEKFVELDRYSRSTVETGRINLNNKYVTQVFSMFYNKSDEIDNPIISHLQSKLTEQINKLIPGIVLNPELTVQQLSELRNELFKRIMAQAGNRDLSTVAFLDYLISIKEAPMFNSFLQSHELNKLLEFFISSKLASIPPTVISDSTKNIISTFINIYNYKYPRGNEAENVNLNEENENEENMSGLSKNRKKFKPIGGAYSVLQFINYRIKNDEDYNFFEKFLNLVPYKRINKLSLINDLEKLINSFNPYVAKYYFYKPSVCSEYQNAFLQEKFIEYGKITSFDDINVVIKFYMDIYHLLSTLKYDAIESNDYIYYQEKLDDLFLFIVACDSVYSLDPNIIICFLVDYLIRDPIIKDYFLNLLDKQHILNILQLSNQMLKAIPNTYQSLPLSGSKKIRGNIQRKNVNFPVSINFYKPLARTMRKIRMTKEPAVGMVTAGGNRKRKTHKTRKNGKNAKKNLKRRTRKT